MIQLFHCTSPNVVKILIMLEESRLDYQVTPIDIGKGEHLQPEFLKVSLNAKLPAIIDHDPAGSSRPISVFESGAILHYLAEKTGTFLPKDITGRTEVMQWLFWQMANLGPISGQNRHFLTFAPKLRPEVDFSYPRERYGNENNRLYGCLNTRLSDRAFIAGEYSIADMACYPWITFAKDLEQELRDFPHLADWFTRVGERDAVRRAYMRNTEIANSCRWLGKGVEAGSTDEAAQRWEGIAANAYFKTAQEVYKA